MQPKQQRALDLILTGHSTTDIAAQVGVRRETVWRWTQDPAFAAEVTRHRAERRMTVHSELDAGVLEAVRMLRGLVNDTEAPAGARVRAATALMDRAGLTPAYAVEIRHKDDQQTEQACKSQLEDADAIARDILRVLPDVVAVLGPEATREALDQIPLLMR